VDPADTLYRDLKDSIRPRKLVVVAFSAGADSTLLLRAAVDALGPKRVVAAVAVSPSFSEVDCERAREQAAALGCSLEEVQTHEMDLPLYRRNPPDRCYHCRKVMMQCLGALARERGADVVLEGSLRDDDDDWRPGARAMAEAGAEAPMRDLGFTKKDVREISRRLGLPTAALPSGACLASRIPYGEEITRQKLRQVEEAEGYLRSRGFDLVRVRHHGVVARIEVDPQRLADLAEPIVREEVRGCLTELGFTYVSVDLRGYRTGSLNEVLSGDGP